MLGEGRPLDDTFAGHPALARLDARDRAFARLLVTTVLRRLGQIDVLLEGLMRARPKAIRVHNLLRLGVAQLLFLDTPAHAAVAETVALAARLAPGLRQEGLINAVLRRVAREGKERLAQQDADSPQHAGLAVAELGHGLRRADRAHDRRGPPGRAAARSLGEIRSRRLGGATGGEPLYGNTVRRPAGGAIEDLPGYAAGAWWVQDAAAALPARLLGDVGGRAVIDLCAAPGGKTAQLAAAGARVIAVELSDRRAQRLRTNLKRLELEAQIEVADALDWRPPRPVGHVLLDAPCTATGTIRRHPDIAWHKTPEDVMRMATLQRSCSRPQSHMLEPGGILVYAELLVAAGGRRPVDRAGARRRLADGAPAGRGA